MKYPSPQFALLLAVLALFASPPPAASQDPAGRDLFVSRSPRRALLIGNDDYQSVRPLVNAVNDARDLAGALEGNDFQVEVVLNADLRKMSLAIDRFISELQPGDVAYFHFSGHGLQVEQENYLIPTDFELKDAASLRYDAYSASKVHDRIAAAGARLSILTLDACRNNGFSSTRGAGGLAPMSPAHGSFIAFATGPGHTADDNPDGRNGLFTAKLLDALGRPGLELSDVFRSVREEVSSSSGGRQVPWTISSVLGRFYFIEPELDSADPSPNPPTAAELTPPPDTGPPAGTLRRNPRDGVEYVWIPPGEFLQGCAPRDSECDGDEKPRRPVRITRGFWMAKTETTVGSWEAFAKAHGIWMPIVPGFIPGLPFLPPIAKGHNPKWRHKDFPMPMIPFEGADRYCREAAGGRLPTEAEWEYAARGGREGAIYPWGDEISRAHANYGADACCGPTAIDEDRWLYGGPAASLKPNDYGLHDMIGGLWEWTRDWYSDTAYERAQSSDPRGPDTGTKKVIRGGSWDNTPRQVRSSDRLAYPPATVSPNIGFRCVVFELAQAPE